MKNIHISIVLMFILVLGSFSAIYATANNNHHGKTIYVSKSGTDRNDGLSPEKAKKNIENALNIADDGDTIIVGPGFYQINLDILRNVSIVGNGQETTVIQGEKINEGSPGCVRVHPGANASVSGFTIKNGNPGQYSKWGPFGGGVYNKGVLTLKDLTIKDCNGDYGGGICNEGTLTMQNVTVKNNSAKFGGGIRSEGPLFVEDCNITNNTATTFDGGGINSQARATIRRSNIQNNHAVEGGGIHNNDLLILEDSVIRDNTASYGGGISSLILYIYNTTVTNNRADRGGGIYTFQTGRSYVDDLSLSLIHENFPNNFGGKPYTPA